MQSFLQYRRFRGAIQAQIERHQGEADAYSRGENVQLDYDNPNASGQPSDDGSDKEGEKGDNANSDDHAHGPGPERRDMATTPARNVHSRHHPTEEVEKPVEDDDDDDSEDWQNIPESLEHRPTNLSRMTTQRSRGGDEAARSGTALGVVMTGINIRKRKTNEGGDGNVFIVGYEGDDDPLNPHNWGYAPRIFITFMVAAIGFVVGFASSIDSEALPQAAAEFHVSEVVEILATGLYLVGFGAGALFAGPFSETFGRNPVYVTTMLLYMIFVMASGLSPNIGAQLAFRFLAGFFGSTPLVCAGGSLSDIWSPAERTWAFPVFANAAFLGPILGPVVGGYIAQHLSTWRWVDWITLIMSGLVFIVVVLFVPETFPPILLKWKAKHLRQLTGNDRYLAEIEVRKEGLGKRLLNACYRPFILTATEPIILLVALYLTVIYIILFTFLDGYTYIFEEIHGTSQGVTGLCFLGIAIGLFLATPLVFLVAHIAKRAREKNNTDSLPPEFRLWFGMFGAPAIPISLFWMGWTSDSNISIWSPLAASVLFGYGILCVFISSYQYIIDSYEVYAASALASVTLIRYVAAGGMTVVGIPFYENMGVHYTLTILGAISALMVPVPYCFYIFGHKLRARSKYAPSDERK